MPDTQVTSQSPEEDKKSFVNDIGIELVRKHAPVRTYVGFGRFSSYKTNTGEWLIGYGSKCLHNRSVDFRTRGSQKDIENQLVLDLKGLDPLVQHYVQMPLNKKKRAAVLSYAHSIGITAFKDCNLLHLINTRASKNKIIREWSPYINRKDFYPEALRERRRVELNTYLAPDEEVPLLFKHTCPLKQCLLNLGESYAGTPNQVKAIEYLEKKIDGWDANGEVMRRFFKLWNQEQGGLGSPKNT